MFICFLFFLLFFFPVWSCCVTCITAAKTHHNSHPSVAPIHHGLYMSCSLVRYSGIFHRTKTSSQELTSRTCIRLLLRLYPVLGRPFPLPDSRLPILCSLFPVTDSRFPLPDSRSFSLVVSHGRIGSHPLCI